MRLEIKATKEELATKSIELINRLESLLRSQAPDTAEMLRKALPEREKTLRYPVLQDLHKQTTAIYQEHVDKMLDEIGKVLDRSLPAKKT